MAGIVVTLDGPAGSGKSTVARLLAQRLGAVFLDTGAMYRAVTLAAMRDGADLEDEWALAAVVKRHRFDFEATLEGMRVALDGGDVTENIRSPQVTENSRHAASSPKVRQRLVEMQRDFAARCAKLVTEGRDQGTVVFPDAAVKFYLTADAAERARRRMVELAAKGIVENPGSLQRAMEERDRRDESRAVGPLRPAPDALLVDTTHLNTEQVVQRLLELVQERCRTND